MALKKRSAKHLILFAIVFGMALLVWFQPRLRTHAEQMYFDLSHTNSSVHSKAQIDSVLNAFQVIEQHKLPKGYLTAAGFGQAKYRRMAKNMQYYTIHKKDCYRHIVGNIRIKDLISKDSLFYQTKYASDQLLYWGIDKRILYKIQDLQASLIAKNFNPDAFTIVNGHRYPNYNARIGGASKSRHIVGEAVDMYIGDIDKSGFLYTRKTRKLFWIYAKSK